MTREQAASVLRPCIDRARRLGHRRVAEWLTRIIQQGEFAPIGDVPPAAGAGRAK
jgi:hypothetical protein